MLGAFLHHSATDRARRSCCGSRARRTPTSTRARCIRTSGSRRCARSPARCSLRRVWGVKRPFDSLYSHGFARVAAAVPHLRPAEPGVQRRAHARARRARRRTSARRVVVFPELGLSAYAIDDLLPAGRADRRRARAALERIVAASRGPVAACSSSAAPLRAEGGLFNCGVVIHRGRRARRRAQELPARVPRVLRGAPVPRRARADRRRGRAAGARRCRAATTSSSPRATCPGCVAPRRDLRGPVGADPAEHATARWRARRCSRTCRRATSRSARPTTGARCARRSPRARSPPTSTPPRARASRRPTSRGTARR